MSDEFVIQDVADAQNYLTGFDARTAKEGTALFKKNNVTNLLCVAPSIQFSADVQDEDGLFDVELEYFEDAGWTGSCGCEIEFECAHCYAAMKALLAEHSLALVRNISSNQTSHVPQSQASSQKSPLSFQQKVAQSLDRPLTSSEKETLDRISKVYRQCQSSHRITYWDFDEMGLSLRSKNYGWDILRLWEVFPFNEEEFWQYVAVALNNHNHPIPKFLAKVTDLNAAKVMMSEAKQRKVVADWKSKFSHYVSSSPKLEVQSAAEFRLVVGSEGLSLEWKPPIKPVFSTPKKSDLNQFVSSLRYGSVSLAPEDELLLQILRHRIECGYGCDMAFHDPVCASILRQVFRQPMLHPKIVALDETPIRHVDAPLV